MKEESDLDLYFSNFKEMQEAKIIESVEILMRSEFPDIQELEVTMTSVKYNDPRYSFSEVVDFVQTLYRKEP